MSSDPNHDEVRRCVRAIAAALERGQTMTAPLETDLAKACRRAVLSDFLASCATLRTRVASDVLEPLSGRVMRMLAEFRRR